jgi:hypothetical protein
MTEEKPSLEQRMAAIEELVWKQTVGIQVLAGSVMLLERILLKQNPGLEMAYSARLREMQNLSVSALISPSLVGDVQKQMEEIVDRPWEGDENADTGPEGTDGDRGQEEGNPDDVPPV